MSRWVAALSLVLVYVSAAMVLMILVAALVSEVQGPPREPCSVYADTPVSDVPLRCLPGSSH